MDRSIGLSLSILLVVLCGSLAWTNSVQPPIDSWPCRIGLCTFQPASIDNEPSNPFSWIDLAEAEAERNNLVEARTYIRKAVQFGPHIPAILIRAANIEVGEGNYRAALPYLRHTLELTPAYDGIIFVYLARSEVPMGLLLSEAFPDPGPQPAKPLTVQKVAVESDHASAPDSAQRPPGESARRWFQYLVRIGHPDTHLVWEWLRKRNLDDPDTRIAWVEYLVAAKKDYKSAVDAWADLSGSDRGDYLKPERVYNAAFKNPLTPSRFDWKLANHPHVFPDVSDGLKLTFDGQDNITFSHVYQFVYLPAGAWRITAHIRSATLSTDQRPYIRVYDAADRTRLDVMTEMVAPSIQNGQLSGDFRVPAGGSLARVDIQRAPSGKFDSKIQGVLHLDSISIRPL